MDYDHPLDRLGVRLRPLLIVGAGLCFPIFMVSYGLMVKHALMTWPVWGSVLTVIAHLVVCLGIAGLLDTRQERSRRQQDEQF